MKLDTKMERCAHLNYGNWEWVMRIEQTDTWSHVAMVQQRSVTIDPTVALLQVAVRQHRLDIRIHP